MAITWVLMAVVVLSVILVSCKHHLGVTEVTVSCWALQINSNLLKIEITIPTSLSTCISPDLVQWHLS